MMGASVCGANSFHPPYPLGLAPQTSVTAPKERKYVIARKAEKAITDSYIRFAIKKSFTGYYRGSLIKKRELNNTALTAKTSKRDLHHFSLHSIPQNESKVKQSDVNEIHMNIKSLKECQG
jgi:hypothetical protein